MIGKTEMEALLNCCGFILIGALAGWIAGQTTQGKSFGLFGNIILGVIGAVVGDGCSP
jgi:uncharacterized membrane protein YeaQ/YmgE (transglycosylase-associated protein family)